MTVLESITKDYGIPTVTPPQTTKRCKTGCLCCRKRKIKCDGMKPTCDRCLKSSYECIWPKNGESLPHSNHFKLTKVSRKVIKFVRMTYSTSHESGVLIEEKSHIPRSVKEQVDITAPNQYLCHKMDEKTKDLLFRRYLEQVSEKTGLSSVNRLHFWIPGQTLSHQDSMFYDAFLRGFLVSVSPQLAHMKLQPASVFVPPGLFNPILRSVFYACGAAYLRWRRGDMDDIAEAKYEESVTMLFKFMSEGPIKGNEYWIIVAVLCLCIRERFHAEDVTRNILRLSILLEMIRLWLESKGKYLPLPRQSLSRPRPGSDLNRETTSNVSLLFELILVNLFEESVDPSLGHYDNVYGNIYNDRKADGQSAIDEKKEISNISPFADCVDVMVLSSGAKDTDTDTEACERTIIESFLYNYSVQLFICDKAVKMFLPSPFIMFKAFRGYLVPPLYKCQVPWMNNPVMGASLSAFEIAAKVNWLSLDLPLTAADIQVARSLLNTAQYYTMPILPAECKASQPESVQRLLIESCVMGEIVAKASIIFLIKLLHPMTPGEDPRIQCAFSQFKDSLAKLSVYCQVSTIFAWPLAVAGVAAVTKEDQEYLFSRAQSFLNVTRSESTVSVLRYLKIAWNGPGIDVLLDRSYAKYLFL